MRVTIRPERASDVEVIDAVIRAAFAVHPHSDQTEHLIVRDLRQQDVLSISLVAEADHQVAGHIAFSPVTITGGAQGWFGLGPVAVCPRHQGQGMGSALVRAGLRQLTALDAQGCVLLGAPTFYRRFGFEAKPELVFKGAPQAYFLSLALGSEKADGEVTYHESFYAQR